MQALSKLPDTLDEIDAMLNEEQSRAECFAGLSESVRAHENQMRVSFVFVLFFFFSLDIIKTLFSESRTSS